MIGKYGSINIDGKCMYIDEIPTNELGEYLTKLNDIKNKIIEKQNSYISEILNKKGE